MGLARGGSALLARNLRLHQQRQQLQRLLPAQGAHLGRYHGRDARLHAAFIDAPLTPKNTLGFMLPTDDADYVRVMDFVWGLVDSRGGVKQAADKWLK